MENLILNLCIYLDSSREEQCYKFINQFYDILNLILNSKYILIIFFLIIFIFIKIIFTNENKVNDKYYFSLGLFSLFLLIIINFRTDIPWVDDWEWIENLQLKKYSIIEWLIQPTNIHNIFFTKLIFLTVDKFFNLNLEIFSFLSIIIIFLISIKILHKEKKLDHNILVLVIFLIFSGKQFANISQSSNIVWTLSFMYIILFNYLLFKNIYLTSLIIFIAPLTFGLGYTIPLYNVFFIYFAKISRNKKIQYLTVSICSIFLAYSVPQFFLDSKLITDSGLNYLHNIFNIKFYFVFFALIANVYVPWVNGLSSVGFIIGITQIFLVLFFLYKDYINLGKSELINFLNQNILLIIGIIFSLIVSITRPDFQTAVAARYSVGSIIFQIGFWLFFAKKFKPLIPKFQNLIKILIIYVFISGLFFPYQGIHWQAKRYSENNKIIYCLKKNKEQEICIKNAYEILFYGGQWYNYKDFKLQIEYLIKNKKSFLSGVEK